jgi:uncharacterized tellurite resistance protein B-like protein
MSYLENFDHPLKKQNKGFFSHLVKIAMADGIIWPTELELLHQMGRKLGFTDPEIKNMIDTAAKQDYDPPYELLKRFEHLYDIVKMTLADGQIDENEMSLAKGFAVKSGFKESEIPALLVMIMCGIREGKDDEDLFEVYKKTRKSLY